MSIWPASLQLCVMTGAIFGTFAATPRPPPVAEPCRLPSGAFADTLYTASPERSSASGTISSGIIEDYARGQAWYGGASQLRYQSSDYGKYGSPMSMSASDPVQPDSTIFVRIGWIERVPVYTRLRYSGVEPPLFIFIPVQPACEFQAYVDWGRVTL